MTLAELANGEPLDVAIIGGGINGCGIARELALRGMCCKDTVAGTMATLLGWDANERERQLRAFESDAAYHIPTLSELATE